MSDEVLYYATREFMSRKGIEYGSITLHPDGVPHGPHPGRTEASLGAKETERAGGDDRHVPPAPRGARRRVASRTREYYRSWIEPPAPSADAAPMPALTALLSGLVDYAGLFPPARLDMPAAVRAYAGYRQGPHARMLGSVRRPRRTSARVRNSADGPRRRATRRAARGRLSVLAGRHRRHRHRPRAALHAER